MKKMLSLILALVLVVSLIPAASARETRCYAEQLSPERIRIALGQTVTVQSSCYSEWAGGYGLKLYRITEEEAKDPLATGRRLLKNNAKYLDEDGEYCYYGGDVHVKPDFHVNANELGVGTYLHVAYTFDCTGKVNKNGHHIHHEKTYNYTEIAVNVVEIVEEEIPITGVSVYICEEDGTLIAPFDTTQTLNVGHDEPTYLRVVTEPENATERLAYGAIVRDGIQSWWRVEDGQDVFSYEAYNCGELQTEYYVQPYADDTEKRLVATVNSFVDHEPQEKKEVIYWYTCTEPGLKAYRCKNAPGCKVLIDETLMPPPGHTLKTVAEVVNEPTATKPGVGIGQCKNCLSHVGNGKIPAIFSDVLPDVFYSDALDYGYDAGWVTGTSATTFGPTGECLRAHVVTFLWRAAGCPEPTSAENPFVDVSESDFFHKAVLWAVENGITNGTDEFHFNPNMPCNRAQVVTFLYRAMQSPEVGTTACPFTDVVRGEWYEPAVLWAVENGITNGLSADTFGVDTTCNRAQVVTFLYRTYVN